MGNSFARSVIQIVTGGGALATLAACGALIGTRDLTEVTADGGVDAPSGADGAVAPGSDASDAITSDASDGAAPDSGDSATPACAGADLQSDPHHCGRCDHDCLGGACTAGVCQAFALVPNQSTAIGLAVDDSGVYWSAADVGAILTAAKDGTGKRTIVTESNSLPFAVAVDGTDVYWTNANRIDDTVPGRVNRCAKSGCATPTHLTPAVHQAYGIAVDAAHVYWTEYDNGAVGRASKTDGSGLGYLVTQQGFAFDLLVTDQWLYFTADPEVGAVPPNGPVVATHSDTATAQFRTIDPTSGTDSFQPYGLALDDTTLYWANRSILGAAVFDAPKDSTGQGPIATFAPTTEMPTHVAVDDTNVYWVAQGPNTTPNGPSATYSKGVLATCPKAGCPNGKPIVLAQDLANPFWVVVDKTAVYFTLKGNSAGEGAVMKIAK